MWVRRPEVKGDASVCQRSLSSKAAAAMMPYRNSRCQTLQHDQQRVEEHEQGSRRRRGQRVRDASDIVPADGV